MRNLIRHWWLFVVIAGCSSRESGTTVNLWTEGAANRDYVSTGYDTIWAWGGVHDTILAAPHQVTGTPSGGVALFDVQMQRVRYFDAQGTLKWSWGTTGQGPGEIRDVRALTVAPSGEIVLVDSGNGRLFILGEDGSIQNEARLEAPAYVDGVAVLGMDRYLLSTDSNPPWMIVDRNGKLVATVQAPWAGFDRMTFIQWHGHVTRWRDGAWVFGFGYGNGWFVFQDDGSSASYPYVEHTDFPQVISQRSREGLRVRTVTTFTSRPPPSAISLSAVGDTLVVLFDGETGGVLDKYDLHTGAYLHSTRVGSTVGEMTALGNGTYAVVDYEDLYPTVAVVRARVDQGK